MKKQTSTMGIVALVLYVIGGFLTFPGVALIFLFKGKDLFGWGDARSIGYLFVCVGISLSFLGVLFMRLFRNRGLV